MEVKAKARYVRMSPRKVRLVVDLVRGMQAEEAVQQLHFLKKGAAEPVRKLISSALANAENNFGLKREQMFIKQITADDGPTYYRYMPRAFGRATPLRKRSTHIMVTLDEQTSSEKPAKVTEKKPASKPAAKKTKATPKKAAPKKKASTSSKNATSPSSKKAKNS